MASVAAMTVRPVRHVRGRLVPPGDKSISHRYAILAALAAGRSRIDGFAPGDDCVATLSCLRGLGVEIEEQRSSATLHVHGRHLGRLLEPVEELDARNSGTTLRLLAGVLGGHPFTAILTGDDSLRRRPMKRVIDPLAKMGAHVESDQGRPPLTIRGGALRGIDWTPDVPSAQVKSALLLAGLHASGRTRVREPAVTRNHTELALAAFGAGVQASAASVEIEGGQQLRPVNLSVPGDFSSAAFWLVAAAALPGSDIEVLHVGLNPTRTALLDVLDRAGARVETTVDDEKAGEPRGRVRVRPGEPGRITVDPAEVPALIDELPALAALATHGGALEVSGASELRIKESDRIATLIQGIRALGGTAEEWPDGFRVDGRRRLHGGVADAAGDHRTAMALAVAALGASRPCTITGAEAVVVSYPAFFDVLDAISGESR